MPRRPRKPPVSIPEGIDEDLVDLFLAYVASFPEQVRALEAAILLAGPAPDQGQAALRGLAHKLRGSAATYQLPAISQAAGRLEDAPVAELEALAKELIQALRAASQSPRRKAAAAPNKSRAPGSRRRKAASGRTRRASDPAPPRGAAGTVLVVEDDPVVCRLLELILRAPGREIVIARTAAEASRMVGEGSIDLILLDLHLPDGDGRRLLVDWRTAPATSTVPLFVMSADLGSRAKAECFAAGADAFFEKPLRREVIEAAVRARLARAGGDTAPVPVESETETASEESASAPAPAASRAKASPDLLQALVIEDDAFVAAMVKHRLTRAGFNVRSATTGTTGLAALKEAPTDLVVLDLNLPEVNGFQVLERLRADAEHHTTPVLILTASGAEKDLVRAFALGADDYLVKPFSPTELLARVQRPRRRAGLPSGKAGKPAP
ncbi:MAG: response regulator [Gemmatimonadales bacterium]